jgi:DNA-binding transcriptional regulator YdaS (Cro superfamily)
MEKLRVLLNSMTTDQQFHFARRCGTTIGYLRKRINTKAPGRFGLEIASAIERESFGQVRVEDLLPDADIAHLRARAARRQPHAA